MKSYLNLITIVYLLHTVLAEDVRLVDLEPPDAQQQIEKQDQSLHYAPKIESNVPAVRYLGNEPHDVQEDIYLARQYHGQDGLGGYLYGYNIPDIAKTEKKVAGGDLRGAYNYVAQDGQEIKVEYWDDGTGFHQIDNVPKILPKQIDDSPEVKAEKEKFLARWHEEAERNQHPVASPYDSNGNYASGPLSPQGQAEFKQQYGNQYPQGAGSQQNQYTGTGSYPTGSGYSQSSGFSQQKPYTPGGQTGYNQQQPGQSYQSGTQYQSTGSYQQSGQPQQQSQYQSTGFSQQNPGQYQSSVGGQTGYSQQPGQTYQTGTQYQSSGSYQQPSQSSQYGGAQPNNQIDYTGQYSENQNVYSRPATSGNQYNQKQNNEVDSGAYDKKYEDENEENGPPKGFFYKFDYPVGKIVSVGGIARGANLKSTYEQNKSNFESQLQAGHSTNGQSQSGYLYSH